jgi:hypothetical protein
MRKIMITMATAAVTAGLFAGTALAGEEGHDNSISFCTNNQNNVLANALADAIAGTGTANAPQSCSGR